MAPGGTKGPDFRTKLSRNLNFFSKELRDLISLSPLSSQGRRILRPWHIIAGTLALRHAVPLQGGTAR